MGGEGGREGASTSPPRSSDHLAAFRYHVQDSGHCCPTGVRPPECLRIPAPLLPAAPCSPESRHSESHLVPELGGPLHVQRAVGGQAAGGGGERGGAEDALGLTNPAPGVSPGISPLPLPPSAPRASLLLWGPELGRKRKDHPRRTPGLFPPVPDGTVLFSLTQQRPLVSLRTDTVSFHKPETLQACPHHPLGPSDLVTSGR